MTASAGALSLAHRVPACPQCARPMEAFELEGHYGKLVTTDLCAHCNVVWFDEFESVKLSGLGWVTLLRRMNAAMAGGAGPLSAQLACPRCSAPLAPVHNLTRFGKFAALECTRKHGHLHTFSLLLAERGLVRPMSPADLRTLASENRIPCCLNCGAAIGSGDSACSYCASPLVVMDMPRLMTALLMRHADALPQETAERIAWPCHGCGAPVSPTHAVRCEQCHHAVVVPSLLDLRPILDKVEPLLRAARPRQARPHGEKLRNLRGDASATGFHSFMRHARDLVGGDADGGVPAWLVLAALAGMFWFFLG